MVCFLKCAKNYRLVHYIVYHVKCSLLKWNFCVCKFKNKSDKKERQMQFSRSLKLMHNAYLQNSFCKQNFSLRMTWSVIRAFCLQKNLCRSRVVCVCFPQTNVGCIIWSISCLNLKSLSTIQKLTEPKLRKYLILITQYL